MNRSARTAARRRIAGRRHGGRRVLTACGSSSSPGDGSASSAAGGTYTVWDPYPQFDGSSDWAKLLASLRHPGRREGQAHGVRHHRPDQQDAAGRSAGQRPGRAHRRQPGRVHPGGGRGPHHAPSENGIDTAQVGAEPARRRARAAARPTARPIGANTLALYYNKNVLKAAGVDPASVKDWASLNAALAKVEGGGQEGHHLLRDRHRGGQLPVPALVLGRRGAADRARLRARRSPP